MLLLELNGRLKELQSYFPSRKFPVASLYLFSLLK